jgi:hypothetical protein
VVGLVGGAKNIGDSSKGGPWSRTQSKGFGPKNIFSKKKREVRSKFFELGISIWDAEKRFQKIFPARYARGICHLVWAVFNRPGCASTRAFNTFFSVTSTSYSLTLYTPMNGTI